MKKAVLPAQDEPLVIGGGRINPIWYAFFTDMLKRGVLDMPDVSGGSPSNGQFLVYDGTAKKMVLQPTSAPSNGQVLIYNSVSGKWEPGAN